MIRKIKIRNIQSHKDTTLEFSPGINAIVGSSNNGKSAILRALYWLRYNRPLGTDTLLSHWAFDKKGNQIEEMSVTVENDNGVVKRARTKTENKYIINEHELNVVKTDVPKEVEGLLKLSDTNIQKQQDAPFLLSLSGGQVAQYFNKTVRLDVIDKVLSNAESKRRKASQELKQTEELLNGFEQRKNEYCWLNAVEKLIAKYDNITSKKNKNENEIILLKQQFDDYATCSNAVSKYNSVFDAKKLVDEFEQQQKILAGIAVRKNVILDKINRVKKCKKEIYPSFNEQKNLIAQINSIDVEGIREEKIALQNQLEKINCCNEEINSNNKKIKELKKQLPKVCPLCGAIMKEGVCKNEN